MSDSTNDNKYELSEKEKLAVASFLDLGDKLQDSDKYELHYLDITQDLKPPKHLLEYQGVGFFLLGGLQAITGKKKNGKTFLMTQLMCALLGCEKLGMLRRRYADDLPEQATILYIDTEMEEDYTLQVARRVHYLMDWKFKEPNPRFYILPLNAEDDPDVRWKMAKQAIEEINPTATFLDGLRDVIHDINDSTEATERLDEMRGIARKRHMAFCTALHENPGNDKMRGAIGTELGNKVSDTLRCEKQKKDGSVTFLVTQPDARGKDVPDWKFYIDDTRVKFGSPVIMGSEATDINEEVEKQHLASVMHRALTEPLGKTNLQKVIKQQEGIGSDKAYSMIIRAEDFGIIDKKSEGRYRYIGIPEKPQPTVFDQANGDEQCPYD